MTQDEINALGIAFFSGNALQYKPSSESRHWLDWTGGYFPDLRSSNKDEWRIKPDEPKKEIWCTFRSEHGYAITVAKGSIEFREHTAYSNWTHIPSLDREVILPEGVE